MYENLSEEELIKAMSSPGPALHQIARSESLKAELTRRLLVSNKLLNESIIKLDGATRHNSRILIVLTIVIAVIALVQIGVSIWGCN